MTAMTMETGVAMPATPTARTSDRVQRAFADETLYAHRLWFRARLVVLAVVASWLFIPLA